MDLIHKEVYFFFFQCVCLFDLCDGLKGLPLFHLNLPSAKAATQSEGIDCMCRNYTQGNF